MLSALPLTTFLLLLAEESPLTTPLTAFPLLVAFCEFLFSFQIEEKMPLHPTLSTLGVKCSANDVSAGPHIGAKQNFRAHRGKNNCTCSRSVYVTLNSMRAYGVIIVLIYAYSVIFLET
jgi:hypothetical protein